MAHANLPIVDVSDPPFALPGERPGPIVTVVDLPFPPSVNAIWRQTSGSKARGNITLTAGYRAWKSHADGLVMANAQLRGRRQIMGRFRAELVLDKSERKRAGDLDNRIKSVLDWCQSRDLIANDRHLEVLLAFWGIAPFGCRVTLTEMP